MRKPISVKISELFEKLYRKALELRFSDVHCDNVRYKGSPILKVFILNCLVTDYGTARGYKLEDISKN